MSKNTKATATTSAASSLPTTHLKAKGRPFRRPVKWARQKWEADAEAALGGYDISDPQECARQARWERRSTEPSFTKEGCVKLVAQASEFYTEMTGHQLPWNLEFHGIWSWESRRKNLPMNSRRQKALEAAARTKGWLEAAAHGPKMIRTIIEKTTSSRGVNSPATTMDLHKVIERFRTPFLANKKLWKVRERAAQILKGFGLSPSWNALGRMLQGDCSAKTGRAAHSVVKWTIQDYTGMSNITQAIGLKVWMQEEPGIQSWAMEMVVERGEFSSLKEALAHKSRLKRDLSDGVDVYIDPSLSETRFNVRLTPAWKNYGEVWDSKVLLCVQNWTRRTFHADRWVPGSEENATFLLKRAAREAIAAWTQRKRLEKAEADIIDFLKGKHSWCPLVERQDSYNAGNCSSGTEAWMRKNGIAHLQLVPGVLLIKHLDHQLARNVAVSRYNEWQRSIEDRQAA